MPTSNTPSNSGKPLSPAKPPADPGLPSIGMLITQVPNKGYVLTLIETLGDKIVSTKILAGPDARQVIAERWKICSVQEVFPVKGAR